ncbi:MAG: hypothetical protein GXY55_15155 [Phycisphaerae bacterium]|nr:hypothetical protein [Phycisphaerae bacterium]
MSFTLPAPKEDGSSAAAVEPWTRVQGSFGCDEVTAIESVVVGGLEI